MQPRHLLKAALLVHLALAVTVFTRAQGVPGQQAGGDLRVDVRLVSLTGTVTDQAGHYVGGLTAEDFIVEEDGVRQEIAHFTQDHDIPVSVGIVLDTSGSMERKIRTAIDAVDRFVRTVHPDDDIFLMTFSGSAVLQQDFTSDRNKLSKALRAVRVSGGTAMYDAVQEGLRKIRSGRHDKRAILLISDGEDTSSRIRFNETLQGVRKSELLIYALGIAPPTFAERTDHVPFVWPPAPSSSRRPLATAAQRDAVDMNILNSFASNSGGRAFLLSDTWVGRGSQLDRVLTEIANELRSQYTLGYYPKGAEDSRFHSITVRARGGHVVRARTGYVAASPQ